MWHCRNKQIHLWCSLIFLNLLKMVEFGFHSLESLVCLDSLPASTFIYSSKYSAIIVIFLLERYCQNSLLITINFWFLVPSIFIKGWHLMLSMRMLTGIAFFSFNVKEIIANLAALSSKTFYEAFTPPRTMPPLFSCLNNLLHSLVMMHLILILFQIGEKLKISHCTESSSLLD